MNALTYKREGDWITVSIPVPKTSTDKQTQDKRDSNIMLQLMEKLREWEVIKFSAAP